MNYQTVLACVLPVYLINNAGYNCDSAAWMWLGWHALLADSNVLADVYSHALLKYTRSYVLVDHTCERVNDRYLMVA